MPEPLHAALARAKTRTSLTLEQIADLCEHRGVKVHWTAVSHFIRGERTPSIKQYIALCAVLGVPEDERNAALDGLIEEPEGPPATDDGAGADEQAA